MSRLTANGNQITVRPEVLQFRIISGIALAAPRIHASLGPRDACFTKILAHSLFSGQSFRCHISTNDNATSDNKMIIIEQSICPECNLQWLFVLCVCCGVCCPVVASTERIHSILMPVSFMRHYSSGHEWPRDHVGEIVYAQSSTSLSDVMNVLCECRCLCVVWNAMHDCKRYALRTHVPHCYCEK